MRIQKIQVLGGSASTAFALEDNTAWPNQVAKAFPKIEITHKYLNGLTFVRSINILHELEHSDVLILHFGTSVGWPSAVVNLGHRLGLDLHNEFSFHQPALPYKGGFVPKLGKKVKLKLRNFIKYLLFFLGLYRPRASFRELEEQIGAVLSIALTKADHVIWIQHRSLDYSRIALESLIYSRYYRKILKFLNLSKLQNLIVLELNQKFLISENFLNDGVHLSERGHSAITNKIVSTLSGMK